MNRLADQTSPYLQQHADNPVEWHPWDDQALELARREDKPILLSIGYSACHWCHVMARESFESNQVALLMNTHFVNIKVDREERPDIDRIYQTAHQILVRKPGGWPLTMFLDPHDLLPFYGGTYFPAQARQGMPGFRDVLKGLSQTYGQQQEKMQEFKQQIRDALSQVLGGGEPGEPEANMVERACGQIDASFDADNGGFSEAPKFPHPAGLELLLDTAAAMDAPEKSERALEMLDMTLLGMSRGGVFDHLGGGFFRYSTDKYWEIPHFEKMLYDNGALLSLFARRAASADNPWFAEVANTTADWVMREMQLKNGGICASLDADCDGSEGAFYQWHRDAVKGVLGEDYETFKDLYGLNKKANFNHNWHLRLAQPESAADLPEMAAIDAAAANRAALLTERNERTLPARDDKVLSGWNGLAIRGLADNGRLQQRAECITAAQRAVDYLRASHWVDGRLLATSRDGKAQIKAYLDDYVFLIEALLSLLQAEWRNQDVAFATDLADVLLAHFEDTERGGFYFTSDEHEELIQRAKSFGDDAVPSGNGIAARVLQQLGSLLGEIRYTEAAERCLRAGMTDAERWPSAHSSLMRALLDYTTPAQEIVLRGDLSAAQSWLAESHDKRNARSHCYIISADNDALPGILAERQPAAGAELTAYVCVGHTCKAPATDLAAFIEALAD